MTKPRIGKKNAVPLWAALGAPLVGVPLMVGLLALGAPRIAEPATEPTPSGVDSAVDEREVDSAVEGYEAGVRGSTLARLG